LRGNGIPGVAHHGRNGRCAQDGAGGAGTLDDDAVETVVYKNQEACKKLLEALHPVHKKQLLTYLRLADKRLGLLINFQVALIKDGITRIVNGLEDDDHAKSPSRKEA
jgi:hypothetical protein